MTEQQAGTTDWAEALANAYQAWERSPQFRPDESDSSAPEPRRSERRRSPERFLTPAEVASLLGVKESWVYSQARAGRFPSVRIGRYRRFRRETIERWIEEHEHAQAARESAGTPSTEGES